MTPGRQRLGRRGEEVAASRLSEQGWHILERNVRVPGVRGEIDLVARDGRVLVFVEVKAGRVGSRAGPEAPALAVDARKQAKLRSLVAAWLRRGEGRLAGGSGLRFDVVGVRFDESGRVVEWDHLRGAF